MYGKVDERMEGDGLRDVGLYAVKIIEVKNARQVYSDFLGW
jgi:hypothetical protein